MTDTLSLMLLPAVPPSADGKRRIDGKEIGSIWSQLHPEERARFNHIIRRDADVERIMHPFPGEQR
jgi:hypothetical protein